MPSMAVARPPGRPRCDASRKAVLLAAYDLLAEGGLSRFTIEAVAARSGVARTTIYRWWQSKGALAMEGFLEATAAELAIPPSGSVVTDMQASLRSFARLLRGKAGRIIRCIIAEGQSDPETINAFVTGFVTPRRVEIRSVLERGIARGELRADLDVEMVLYSLFGPLHVRALLNEGLDDAWVDRLSGFVLAGCLARGD
ncbi:MAG TPA: TetR/AcrR family transcriptional regulator [Rhodopila sp.]|nr:TetR/AcrR family transcriptional regulator [Rhodopila sp.]